MASGLNLEGLSVEISTVITVPSLLNSSSLTLSCALLGMPQTFAIIAVLKVDKVIQKQYCRVTQL